MIIKEVKRVAVVLLDAIVALILAAVVYVLIKRLTPEAWLIEHETLDLFVHLMSVTLAVYVIQRALNYARQFYAPKNLLLDGGNVIQVSVAVLLVDWVKIQRAGDALAGIRQTGTSSQ